MTVLDADPAPVAVDDAPPAAASVKRSWLRRGFGIAVLAVVAVEIALALPYVDEGASALVNSDIRWLLVAVAFEMVSMQAFARMRRTMLAAGGLRVPIRRMSALTYTSNAMGSTFPGGPAVSSGYLFKRLLNWGASIPAAGFTVLTSTVLSVLAYGSLAGVTALLAGGGGFMTALVLAGLAVLAAAAVVIMRRRGASVDSVAVHVLHVVNRLLRRRHDAGLAGVRRFVSDLRAIRPRTRDWLLGLGFAELNWAADLACLMACCHAVGADRSSLLLVAVAYVAGMSVSSVTLTPGGLGIIDAAMIFALTQGGERVVLATAGVLLYRLISFALVVSVGWVVWGGQQMAARRGAVPAPEAAVAAVRLTRRRDRVNAWVRTASTLGLRRDQAGRREVTAP